MITSEDLEAYVNGKNANNTGLLQDCLAVATALVEKHNKVWNTQAEGYVTSAAPQAIVDRAIMEVASELWHKRNAPNGIRQFADLDASQVVRVARDSMTPAYSLLAPWVVSGF